MKRSFVILLGIVLISMLGSCKAFRNPENLNPMYEINSPELGLLIPGLQNLVVGDLVKIISNDSQVYYMIFDRVEDGQLQGYLTKKSGRKRQESVFAMPITDIKTIKVKRKSPAATIAYVGLWGAVALGVALGLVALLAETVN